MFKAIFNKLNSKNLNPYPPAKHQGLCDKPFCVILEGSQLPYLGTNMLGQKRMDIIVFVPVASYIELEVYMVKVRAALKEIKHLRKTGFETQAIIDDDKKAYTASIEYVLMKKLEG